MHDLDKGERRREERKWEGRGGKSEEDSVTTDVAVDNVYKFHGSLTLKQTQFLYLITICI